jgi:hypothetical protein
MSAFTLREDTKVACGLKTEISLATALPSVGQRGRRENPLLDNLDDFLFRFVQHHKCSAKGTMAWSGWSGRRSLDSV